MYTIIFYVGIINNEGCRRCLFIMGQNPDNFSYDDISYYCRVGVKKC